MSEALQNDSLKMMDAVIKRFENPDEIREKGAYTGAGTIINSDFLNNLSIDKAKEKKEKDAKHQKLFGTDETDNVKDKVDTKEKPIVKKQLALWDLKDLKEIITDINKTEILCKKN